jgi:hypothetical protein
MRLTPARKRWLEGFARSLKISQADVVAAALAAYTKLLGYGEPPQ